MKPPSLPDPISMDPVGEVYAAHGHCAVRLYIGLPDDMKIYSADQMEQLRQERDAWRSLCNTLSGK